MQDLILKFILEKYRVRLLLCQGKEIRKGELAIEDHRDLGACREVQGKLCCLLTLVDLSLVLRLFPVFDKHTYFPSLLRSSTVG